MPGRSAALSSATSRKRSVASSQVSRLCSSGVMGTGSCCNACSSLLLNSSESLHRCVAGVRGGQAQHVRREHLYASIHLFLSSLLLNCPESLQRSVAEVRGGQAQHVRESGVAELIDLHSIGISSGCFSTCCVKTFGVALTLLYSDSYSVSSMDHRRPDTTCEDNTAIHGCIPALMTLLLSKA